MQSIKLISGEEVNKFSTLVRRKEGKLGANQLVKLNMHVYKDYIQKIKSFAGRTEQTKKKSAITTHQEYKVQQRSLKSSSAHTLRPTPQNPSYYYSQNIQLMSMKQFIVFLEQSKRRQQKQERAIQRKRQKQLVQDIGSRIQSSHSRRNLRLTSSSAQRIQKRINQIHYKSIYEK